MENEFCSLEYINDLMPMNDVKLNKIILHTIMNNTQDTFFFKDINSRIIVSSKGHANLWGEEDPKDVIGKTDFDYFPKGFARACFNVEKEIIKTQTPILGIIEKLIIKDGSVMWLHTSKYPLYDSKCNIIGTWGTSRDITLLKENEIELARLNASLEEANKKLKILSSKDSLTGLYNHGYFIEETKKTFDLFKRREEKSVGSGFSIIIFDIDDFKNVNDTFGHLMGDYTIRYIAEIMSSRVRSTDKLFRIGGDEFGLLLYDTSLEDAKIIANEIRETICSAKINFKDVIINSSISLGVSCFNETSSIEDMIDLADRRLYESKNTCKEKCCKKIKYPKEKF